jgi:hypothetical protein
MHVIQALGWIYAALFVGVVVIGYIPALNDAQGYTLGLFRLELKDHALHLGSAIWAAIAAWRSVWATTLYFRLFGPVYALDGVIGFLFGQAFLDGGIFILGPTPIDWTTKLFANLPHMVIGGAAAFIGWWLSSRLDDAV